MAGCKACDTLRDETRKRRTALGLKGNPYDLKGYFPAPYASWPGLLSRIVFTKAEALTTAAAPFLYVSAALTKGQRNEADGRFPTVSEIIF